MRDISPEIIAIMRGGVCRTVLLAEIDHPAGYVRVWTGVGTLAYNGYSWIGIGALGTVQGMSTSSDLQIVDHTYLLTHIPPDYEEFVNASVRGRQAACYIAFLDDANMVIGDAIQIGSTTLDTTMMPIDESGAVSLAIKGQSDLWQLEKPLSVSLTPTEQRKHFPADTGFDYVTTLTVQRIAWTRV